MFNNYPFYKIIMIGVSANTDPHTILYSCKVDWNFLIL